MPNLSGSSSASSTCRCDLRASRLLAGLLILLGLLAAVSLVLSDLNLSAALAVAGGALGWSLRLAYREARRPPTVLLLGEIGQAATRIEDGAETIVTLQRIGFRSGFVLLEWLDVDDSHRRRTLWPDAVPASQRRVLRRRYGTGGDAAAAAMAG